MDVMNDSGCKKTNNSDTKDKVEQGAKGPPCDRTKCLVPAVPPVLKNVGKLAAGVAGMSSGSATEKKVVYSKSKCKMKECLFAEKSKYDSDDYTECGSSKILGQKNKIQNKEPLINTYNPDIEEETGCSNSSTCNALKQYKTQRAKFLESNTVGPSCKKKICTAVNLNTEIKCKALKPNVCSYKQQKKNPDFLNDKTDYGTKHPCEDSKLTCNSFKRKKYGELINKEDVVYSCDRQNNNNLSIKKIDQYDNTSNNFDYLRSLNILTNANNGSSNKKNIKQLAFNPNELNLEAGTSGINNNTNVFVSNDIDLFRPSVSSEYYRKEMSPNATPDTDTTLIPNNVDIFKSFSNSKNYVVDTSKTGENETNIYLEPKKSILKISGISNNNTDKNYYYNTTNAPSTFSNNIDLFGTTTRKSDETIVLNSRTKVDQIDLFNTSINNNFNRDQKDLLTERQLDSSSIKSAPLLLDSNNVDLFDLNRKTIKHVSDPLRFNDLVSVSMDNVHYYEKTKLDLPDLSVLPEVEEDIYPYFIKKRYINVNNCKCKILVKKDDSTLNQEHCKIYKSTLGMNFCSTDGNPRNKTALQPGHSLMDWIRLSHSGKDLTGVGPKAGTLSVSPKQLAEHNTENDAWIAIRGKVYNITAYFDFHPGGKEELMKGVGQDATQMFNAVHPWVNYESILQKCLVGRLTSVELDEDTFSLLYSTSSQTIKVPANYRSNVKSSVMNLNGDITNENGIIPKFDWVQQMDYITTIFYTQPLSNPQVQVTSPTKDNELDIILTYNKYVYKNHLHFSNNIHWPCKVTINWDTGKVEVNFRKIISNIWDDYGTLTQTSEKLPRDYEYDKIKYIVLNNVKENYNTHLIAFQRMDGVKQTIPLGFHIKIYGTIDDQELIRYYTPVPCSFMRKYSQDYEAYRGDVCVLIKSYPEGLLSPTICNSVKGDIFELSPPLGGFDLGKIASRHSYLMFAAGTGITPMLPSMKFILESTQTKCEKLYILYFNRNENDIILRKHFDYLTESDQRVVVKYILSSPDDGWTGLSGHIDANLVKTTIDEMCSDTQLFPVDIFSLICGPLVFSNLTKSLLVDIGYTDENIHVFGP